MVYNKNDRTKHAVPSYIESELARSSILAKHLTGTTTWCLYFSTTNMFEMTYLFNVYIYIYTLSIYVKFVNSSGCKRLAQLVIRQDFNFPLARELSIFN